MFRTIANRFVFIEVDIASGCRRIPRRRLGLAGLVADYSDEHYSIGEPSLIDIMKLRMYEMGLSQLALSKLLGINPSRICEYLSGKREPTLKQARIISQKLNIDPAIVLGA